MNVTDYKEVWQIDAGGEIYEASFEEVVQWIFEGSVLPQDMVKRGNLRWIEARKVPALSQFFNAKERGEPPPVFTSVVDAQPDSSVFATQPQNISPPPTVASNPVNTNFVQPAENNFQAPQNPFETAHTENQNSWNGQQFNEPTAHEFNVMPTADYCSMHPEVPTVFLCGTCGSGFCPACPKSYGGNVKICPFCGAMCKPVKEVVEKTTAALQYERDLTRGFGAEDFFNALAYPFKFKVSLFVGAIMFMLFTLGQSAGSMGSIFLAAGGLICWMLSNMLTFGVMANTIENFAQGKIGGNFMPNFDDFSLWDDVVHPFFLSIAVYVISFGLVIVVIVGTIFWGLNQVSNAISDSSQPQKQTQPFQNNPNFQNQDELYGDGEMPGEKTINQSQNNRAFDEEEEFRKLNEMINEQRKKQIESGIGKAPETQRAERQKMLEGFMKSGLLILLLLGIGFLWGIFYFPAACCVAGYTRSFVATLNPTVGLETIKLLGWDYVKLWFMGFVIVIVSGIIGLILGLVFSAFDMPTVGNLPANAVGAIVWFYLWSVFSVILGFALYKNADKMNLFKG